MKNKPLILILIILLITLLGLVYNGVFSQETSPTSSKLQVTASFYPLFFFAQVIGGNKAEVKNLTPAGAEPHDYDLSTQNIVGIENGNMLVLNGRVESWADKIKDNLKGTNVKIIIASEGLLTKEFAKEGKNLPDPHIWLSPLFAKKEAAKITQGYIEIDPKNAGYYRENEKKLFTKLDDLDTAFKQGLQNCQSKDFITSHAAFGYLAQEYNLNQVAISGLSPDEEPSTQQLAQVAEFAKKNNVKYIFFESLTSSKLSETIASEIDAKTLVLDPIEGLSDDDISAGENYFTRMQENLANLRQALQCSQ